jgi:hypothetical protein
VLFRSTHDFQLVRSSTFFYPEFEVALSKFLYREELSARNVRAFKYIAARGQQHLRMYPQQFFHPSHLEQ